MKRHSVKRIFFIALTIAYLFPAHSFANESSDTPVDTDLKGALWTWAEETDGEQAIFLSKHNGDDWELPVKISNNDSYNVVPSVTKTENDDLWIVWSSFNGQQSKLIYKRQLNGVWSEEDIYYSGLSSNTAPSIGIDKTGKVWLVWAGFDGISDEIYFTTWNGLAFEPGKPITSNSIPDVLPVLGFNDDDQPTVQWQQFSTTGYIEHTVTWTGDEWTDPTPVLKASETTTSDSAADDTEVANKQVKTVQNSIELELPDFITYPDSAAIHIPSNPVQSLPVRKMNKITGSN